MLVEPVGLEHAPQVGRTGGKHAEIFFDTGHRKREVVLSHKQHPGNPHNSPPHGGHIQEPGFAGYHGGQVAHGQQQQLGHIERGEKPAQRIGVERRGEPVE